MTETLHWYAETTGGVQTGNCTVTENGGALHLTADLPAGTLLGLRLMMTVLPILVLAGALVLFRRKFVLTDARAAEISAQLHGEETHHD